MFRYIHYLWSDTLAMQANDPLKLNNITKVRFLYLSIILYYVCSLNSCDYSQNVTNIKSITINRNIAYIMHLIQFFHVINWKMVLFLNLLLLIDIFLYQWYTKNGTSIVMHTYFHCNEDLTKKIWNSKKWLWIENNTISWIRIFTRISILTQLNC